MNLEEFEKDFYKQEERKVLVNMVKTLTQNKEDYKVKIKQALSYLIDNVVKMQQQMTVPVRCIQISLMRYSVMNLAPVVRIDAYGELGILGESLLCREAAIDWPAAGLEELREKTVLEIIEKYSNKLHQEDAQVLLMKTIDAIEYYFMESLRYEWKLVAEIEGLKKLLKTEDFYISAGEYMGDKVYIYTERKPVDIFFNDTAEKLIYRSYEQAVYQNKTFELLDLEGARFINCTFENFWFVNTTLLDCTFIDCSFKKGTFEKCNMRGCVFENCNFYRVVNQENAYDVYTAETGIVCRPYQILGCEMKRIEYKKCNLANAMIRNTIFKNISIDEECTTEHSDFAKFGINKEA